MAQKSSYSGPKYANGNYNSYKKKNDWTVKQNGKRAALNKKNRELGTYGNGDGKDVAHTKSGKTRLMIQGKNRAANGHGKRSRYAWPRCSPVLITTCKI